MAPGQGGATAHEWDGGGAITDALSLSSPPASPVAGLGTMSSGYLRRRSLPAAIWPLWLRDRISAGYRGSNLCRTGLTAQVWGRHARKPGEWLREHSAEAFAAAAVEEVGTRLSVTDFFARVFALAGDVDVRTNCAHCSFLATRYEGMWFCKRLNAPTTHISKFQMKNG